MLVVAEKSRKWTILAGDINQSCARNKVSKGPWLMNRFYAAFQLFSLFSIKILRNLKDSYSHRGCSGIFICSNSQFTHSHYDTCCLELGSNLTSHLSSGNFLLVDLNCLSRVKSNLVYNFGWLFIFRFMYFVLNLRTRVSVHDIGSHIFVIMHWKSPD